MLAHQEPTPAPQAPPVFLDSDNQRLRKRRKDDLYQFESTSVPRPADVCERYAARIEPWWGFAVYGVLYFFAAFVMFAIGMVPAYLLGAAVGHKGATWVHVIAWICGLAAFGLAWFGFWRWIKRKRAATLPLIRDGELVEGRVAGRFDNGVVSGVTTLAFDAAVGRIGVKFYRVQLLLDDGPRMIQVPIEGHTRPAPGTMIAVLFERNSKLALAFDDNGKAHVARVPRS